MKNFLVIIALILLLIGCVYLESWFVVWVLSLFKVTISMLQGFGIVAGLYFVAGFFKVKNKRN